MFIESRLSRGVGFAVALLTLAVGLSGCSSILDPQTGDSVLENAFSGVTAQGFQDVSEIAGSDREAAVQQALDDWRTQGMRSFLKEESGRSLDRANAQVYSFRRGAHDGRIVLLPYGDHMLSYVQFGELRDVMLTQRKSGTKFAPVHRPQVRNGILKQLKEDAFPWLEDQLRTRIVPGQTLLLHDAEKGQTLYFVLVNPNKPNKGRGRGPNGVEAQQEMLTSYSGGGGYACCSYSSEPVDSGNTTSTTTYDYELDPGPSSGFYSPPNLHTSTNASTSVAHEVPCSGSIDPRCVEASINASGSHSATTSSTVDSLSVNGSIVFNESDSCSASGGYTSSASCSTDLQESVTFWTNECTRFTASGETNAGYSDTNPETGYPVSQTGSSSATSTITFNCS